MVAWIKSKIIFHIVSISFIIFSSFLTYYLLRAYILNYNQTYQAPAAEQYLIENLKSQPIQHISLIKSSEKCVRGELTTITMPLFVDRDQERVIADVEEISIKYWNGMQLCVEYNKDVQYLSDSSQKCQKSYKKCGSNLCINNNEECPITEFKSKDQYSFSFVRYGDQDNGNDNYFTYLTTSIQEKQCFNSIDQKNTPVNQIKQYKTLYQRSCIAYGQDNDAQILSKVSGSELIQDNNLLVENKDIDQEYYDVLYNLNIYLSARKRAIPLVDGCVPSELLPELDFGDLYLVSGQVIFILLIIFYLCLASYFPFTFFAFSCKLEGRCCGGMEVQSYFEAVKDTASAAILNGVMQIIVLVWAIFVYVAEVNFKKSIDYLDENQIIANSCLQNHSFTKVKSDLQSIYEEEDRFAFPQLVLSIIGLILLTIIYFVCKYQHVNLNCRKIQKFCSKLCHPTRKHQILDQQDQQNEEMEA